MELINAASSPETQMNGNFQTLEWAQVYGRRVPVTTGLTWGYYGGVLWGGIAVTDGTLTLTNAAANYIVVEKSTGAISVSTAATNWDDTAAYARVYKVTTAAGVVSAVEDHRAGPGGIFAGGSTGGGGGSAGITVADTLPAGLEQGAQWFESDTGGLFMRYVNPDATETLISMHPVPASLRFEPPPVVVYAKWTIKSDAGVTFSNGDKTAATVSGTHIWLANNQFKVSFGRKLYWEVRVDAITANHLSNGLKNIADPITGTFNSDYYANAYNGGIQSGGGWTELGSGTSYLAGDTLMFAIDEAAGKLWLGRNGVWQNSGNPAAGTGNSWGNMPPAITWAAGSGANNPGGVNGTTIRTSPAEMLYAAPAGFTAGLHSTT